MSLVVGAHLGSYEITEPLGAGGMGEVFRARDTRLNRDVAIKVLPAAFAQDADRVARLRREAQVLASLNHPNIAAIYGLEETDGVVALALELVEGEDLAERLKRGALPVDEALAIAKQIADGLEAAHEKGVVHRDLKPANIKLTRDGTVKILDFGLARAYEGDAASTTNSGLSQSPTMSRQMTEAGIILGTAAYMSPEQARGKPVDKRADIWAFGVVLYEMLTGKRLFQGETVSDTLAAVLTKDPDWAALPRTAPLALQRLLRRCLERDPRRRLRDIGDMPLFLEGDAPATARPEGSDGSRWLWWGASLAAVSLAAAAAWVAKPVGEMPLRRFTLALPENAKGRDGLSSAEISPDGTKVAYVVVGELWIQDLAAIEARPVAGATGATRPFWSSDSQWVAYGIGRRLWKAPAGGGAPVAIADLPENFSPAAGGAWRRDGEIILTTGFTGLLAVSDRGGDLRVVLPIDPKNDVDFHEASPLPDGRGVVFYVHAQPGRPSGVDVFDGKQRKSVLRETGLVLDHPVYSKTGHLLYRRSPTNPGTWAVRFSLGRLETTGAPFLVAAGPGVASVSDDGTLVHSPGGSEFGLVGRLTWVDRSGAVLSAFGEPDALLSAPALSPDGRYVAVTAGTQVDRILWVYDVAQGTRTKLTLDPGINRFPSWFPGGARLAHETRESLQAGLPRVVVREADGSGSPAQLAEGAHPTVTRDGRYLVYETYGGRSDINRLDLEKKGAPEPIVNDPKADERSPAVSPDGQWLAYTSDATGRHEVYLVSFPSGQRKRQVSALGGEQPRWRPDSGELYFVHGDSLMAASFATATRAVGTPTKLFSSPRLPSGFDVAPDGKRFLILRTEYDKTGGGITVVQNWFLEFARPR